MEKINDYLNTLGGKLQSRNAVSRSISDIENYPLAKGQCLYVNDYKKMEITFQKGVNEFLGYKAGEYSINHLTSLYHPEDCDMVFRLLKAILEFASENNVSLNTSFFLTYRKKHKDGSYIKTLRQTNIFELDANGRIISSLSMLTDISFIDASEKVQWKFDAPGLDQVKFKKYVTKEYASFFSDREQEILKLLNRGITSSEIGKKLFISKHTVDGHRRNMLRKSNGTNTIDLINFGKINGLL